MGEPWMAEVLRAGDLTLRAFGPGDAEELHEIFSDPATHSIGDGPIRDLAATRDWLRRRVERREQYGVTWYGVRTANGDLIGNAGLFIGRTGDEPELGFEIRFADQNHGFGSRAAGVVAAEGHRAGFARIWATVRARNVSSLHALARVGFVQDRVESHSRGDLVYLLHEDR